MSLEHTAAAILNDQDGKTTVTRDFVTQSPLRRMDALLDRQPYEYQDGDIVPYGRHHLFFLSSTSTSDTKPDGGNPRDAVIPTLPLHQAMWLGTRTFYHQPVRVGDHLERIASLHNVELKASGAVPFVLVTVKETISSHLGVCIVEETDLLFRNKPAQAGPLPAGLAISTPAVATRRALPDAPMLFRYSALAFNSHRIHYDQQYARDVEGFPGPVVHGPLQGALALNLIVNTYPTAQLSSVTFRMYRPVFMNEAMLLQVSMIQSGVITGWNQTAAGTASIIATASLAR